LADVTVHATYVPILYSVTFMADGHEVSVSYYTVETPLSVIPAVPKKTGYMNECWESFNMVGGDLIVQAKYTPIGYRVVFANNNGQPSVTEQAIYDEPVTLRFDLVREGYTFRGWENTADGTVYEGSNGTTVLNLSSTNDSEILLSAIWEPVQYTMTFEGCDHTVTFTVETDPNALQLPEIPSELVKKHHVATWAIPNTLPATDAEIKVAYTEIVYTVIFDLLKDKTGLDPIVKSWQVSMGALAEPKLGGFVWSLDPSLYVPYDLMDAPFVEEKIDGRIEYTLHLYPVGMGDNKYSITFIDDQEKLVLVKNTNAPLNQAIELTIPGVPLRIGYMGKWGEDHSAYQDQYIIEYTKDGKVRVTRTGENAPTSVVIMADYTPIQYTVRYDLAGGILDEGAVLADLTAEYNVTYAVTDMIPTRVGYKFDGWVYTDTDGDETVLAPASNSIINLTTVNHDVVVLKAKWVPIQYSVRVYMQYISGSKYETVEYELRVAYDEEFVLEEMAPANYEQIGWKINEESYEINTVFKNLATDDGTVKVEPVLRGKEHTVELYANGVCVGTVKYRYGDNTYGEIVEEIQKVTIPEKAFYAGEWSIGEPEEYLPLSGEVTIFGMDELGGNGNNRNYIAVVDNNGTILGPTIEGIYDEMFGSMILAPREYGVIFPETITAKYAPVVYDAVFVIDGTIVQEGKYTVESPTGYPNLPTKEHYTAAWDIGTLPGGDVTVTAVYTPIVYTVTFALPDDGTVVDISQYTVEDKTVHMPAVPYGYDAWDIAPLVGGDVTVYALKKNDQNDPIILTFVDNFGNRVGAVTVEEGKQLPPLPTVPEIQGYMGNWKLPETVTESMTVYPEYELIEYRVYFYDENGDIVTVVGKDGQARDYATYTILNHSVTIPSVPFKDFYRGRWDIPALTTGDVEVYAVYEPIVFTVTFRTHDGQVWAKRNYTVENQRIDIPDVPKREGYDRQVWEEFDLSRLSNLNVYPIYTAAEYKVPLGEYGEKIVIFGERYGELPHPNKTGYTFVGWYHNGKQITADSIVSYAGNHTLVPKWTPNTYWVSYDSNGGNCSATGKNVVFDDIYGSLPTPTRKGHTFAGWRTEDGKAVYSDSKVMIPENHTLIATWSINTYVLRIEASNCTVKVKYDGNRTIIGSSIYKSEYKNGDRVPYHEHLVITVTANEGYENATYSIETGNECIAAIDNKFYMPDTDITIKANATKESCFAAGTLVTLEDGTQKKIEDILDSDKLLVFNHETGRYDSADILFVDRDEWTDYRILNLSFSNGTTVRVIGDHGFFDLDLNKYVYLSEENVQDHVGHRFYTGTLEENGYDASYAVLENAYMTTEYTGCYSIITVYHMNYYINDFLSMPADTDHIVNIFEYDENLAFDAEKMKEDIEKYGLFTYDDFDEYVPYEVYQCFQASYFKVAIGKGQLTFDELLELIEIHIKKIQ